VKTDRLDYDLPDSLIATAPAQLRDRARLMVIRRSTGQVEHLRVSDLPDLGIFSRGDLMLVNQTRVVPAYLQGVRAGTGGRVTGLYLESPSEQTWRVMLEARGRLQPGELIDLGSGAKLRLVQRETGGKWLAELEADVPTHEVLARVGQTPLPPYIRRARKSHGEDEIRPDDLQRYNTVFAQQPGSVAAPTAGLHFTPELLDRLEAQGVTRAPVDLHVGIGTFAPVRVDDLADHDMHAEHLTVPAATIQAIRQTRASGGTIFVVGTTTVRAIESLPEDLGTIPQDYTADTRLFIQPDNGFEFRFTDYLMTNFHLPESTLLALVASLPGMGIDRLMEHYQTAIKMGYRFYSYGDAMIVV